MNKCVYFLYDSDNVVRYVGQGSIRRVNELHSGRTKEFKEIAKTGYFKIIETDLTQEQSVAKEKQLLEEYFEGKHPDWNLINKTKGNILKPIAYNDVKDKLKIDKSSPTFLTWDYDCVKSNGVLCSKARIGFKAGSIAKSGYGTLIIEGKSLPIHRVVWVLHNKCDLPTHMVINHIDGNPSDNSPENLEAVSQKENIHKTTKKKLCKSTGMVGVRIVNNSVIAYYSDRNCKQRTKSFNIDKYGRSLAISLAFSWRSQRMIDEYGKDYSDISLGGLDGICDLNSEELKILSDNYSVNKHTRKLVINRRKILDSRKGLMDIFGTESVTNRLYDWTKDGFIGIVIHGYLIEDYNEDIHESATYESDVTPVESLKVHIKRAFIGNGKTFLSPSDFSIQTKGFHDINTAVLISSQTKKGKSVYGVYYREGTIADLNAEILRRLEEHNKRRYF